MPCTSTVVRNSSRRAATNHSGAKCDGEFGSAARRVRAPLSRFVDRESIDDRLAFAARRIDPREPQLVTKGRLGRADAAKSKGHIVAFHGIKSSRSPKVSAESWARRDMEFFMVTSGSFSSGWS